MTRALLLSLVLMSACAAATAPAPEPPTPNEASGAVTLRPGDLLQITIWREEDLSGEFLVDESGTVTVPMLGRIRVLGIPLPELRDSLLGAYAVQLNNPSITIVPLRRVYVLGEVNKPGLYGVDPTISLAGAIAMAEGATSDGDLARVRVVRGSTVIRERPEAGQRLNDIDVRSGDQIYVEERSVFVRNRGIFLSSILSVVTSVLATYIVVEITN